MTRHFAERLSLEQVVYLLAGSLVIYGFAPGTVPYTAAPLSLLVIVGCWLAITTFAFMRVGYGTGMAAILLPAVGLGVIALALGQAGLGIGLFIGGLVLYVSFFTIPLLIADHRDG